MRSLVLATAVMCGVFLSSRPALTQQPTDAAKPDEKAKLLEERLELQRKENELLKKENELLKRETELLKKEGKKDSGKLFTGTTPRVGVVNIWTVVKNYKRTEVLRAELQGIVKKYDDELAATKKALEGRKAQLASDDLVKLDEPAKKAIEKEIRRLQSILTERGEEMREELIKRESEQAVGVFHDIEDTIRLVAVSKGMELVSVYGDTPDLKDRNLPANLARKINSSASIPLYTAPGVDLTEEVVKCLNEKHEKTSKKD
jgi:Skp family chaperone for outer membrane proteins